jgi:hypothetical protein
MVYKINKLIKEKLILQKNVRHGNFCKGAKLRGSETSIMCIKQLSICSKVILLKTQQFLERFKIVPNLFQ